MKKIERTAHPWQGTALDYPTMTLAEIEALPVGDLGQDGTHLYLWVTHRFLPAGLRLVEAWSFRYHCLMTWNKPSAALYRCSRISASSSSPTRANLL